MRRPGNFPYVRGTRATGDWRIREEIDAVDPEKANHAARSAVVAGAEEIAFLQRCESRMLQIWRLCWPTCRKFPFTFKVPTRISFVF